MNKTTTTSNILHCCCGLPKVDCYQEHATRKQIVYLFCHVTDVTQYITSIISYDTDMSFNSSGPYLFERCFWGDFLFGILLGDCTRSFCSMMQPHFKIAKLVMVHGSIYDGYIYIYTHTHPTISCQSMG